MEQLAALRTFVTVVECGSFHGAADRLHISPAAATRHVATLEEQLGVRLLVRSTRRQRLTEIGEHCFQRYQRILEDLDEVQEQAASGASEPRGTLRVCSTVLFWMVRVAPLLPAFLAAHPRLSLELDLSEQQVDLHAHGYDLVLHHQEPLQQSVVVRRITRLARVVCASPAYLARRGTPAAPADLAEHDCLVYAAHGEAVEWAFRTPQGDVLAMRVAGRLKSSDVNTLRLAAVAGLGILRCPRFLVQDDLDAGRLHPILAEQDCMDPDLKALLPARRLMPAKTRVFLDFLVQQFS